MKLLLLLFSALVILGSEQSNGKPGTEHRNGKPGTEQRNANPGTEQRNGHPGTEQRNGNLEIGTRKFVCNSDRKSFSAALQSCLSRGVSFRLAMPKSTAEFAAIMQHCRYDQSSNQLQRNGGNFYWVGGRNTTADEFRYLDGSALPGSSWLPGEPDYEGRPKCLAASAQGLADFDCTTAKYYVCEI